MNSKHEEVEAGLPLPLVIEGPGELLANALLEGKLVRYTDSRFQVSSGRCRFILKLIQSQDKLVLFYAQVPYVYPIPDDLKVSIKTNLEAVMKLEINIEFINAGAQIQKRDIEHMASLTGE